MGAIDTNVLVRLIARDDPAQTQHAEAFVAGGAWVSTLALAESVWVLESVYELGPDAIATALGMLLEHQHLVLQDADAIAAALAAFRKAPKLGFTDCLMLELARKAGQLPLATFDRSLAKLDGAQKL